MVAKILFAGAANIELLTLYAGLGAVLGHNYPFYLNFKGGKGIAATAGLILTVHPMMFLTIAIIFVTILLTTQYVSLGSIVIMAVFAVEVILYGQFGGFELYGMELYEFYVIAIVLAVLAWFRHRANIKRLLSNTENKIDVFNISKRE